MGRTLLGVDLDESAVVGLVERLLTDEEIEMLADGGHPGDDGPDSEGSDSAAATDGGVDSDDADGDRTGESGDAPDAASESDVTANDATHLSSASGAVTDGTPNATGSERGVPSVDPASGEGRPASDETHMGAVEGEDEDEDGGRFARFKPLLIKGAVALVVLAVIGVVLWKYGGTIRSKLPAKLGGTSGESDEEVERPGEGDAADADVSPARRRAKASEPAEATSSASTDFDEDRDDRSAAEDADDRERGPTVGASTDNSDVGALVGLGLLAVVAVIVRKLSEEPPRDPLVDGPDDE
jgi:hypothetical protein